jgi:hypothetical protein
MAYPQPYFHGLTVKATWDGEIGHAVELDITFGIDAIPNSRLRLISLEAATHADMTGVNESSPATAYTGGASTFLAHDVQQMGPNGDHKAPSAITDLSLDPLFHTIHASRIPLPMSRNRSLSPQKRPLPTDQRPPWRSPAFEDAIKSRGRSSRAGESKSMASHSADGSYSPTKPASENFKCLDTTRRGRELLRAEVSRRASYHALSGHGTAEGTPEQKVTQWLDQSEYAPITAPSIIHEYGPKHPSNEKRLGASSMMDAADEKEQFPPSPTPSSQAIVPWTSVRYRNPLRLRGAGCCAASLEKFNGCLYAIFPQDVMQVVHQVQLQAKVHLRKDSENGGHLLELPGLPRQDNTVGCFTLSIVGDDSGEYPAYKKIAHVDKDFGTDVLNGPRVDLTFEADAPLSVKLLCFEDGMQVLQEADFEIVYDVQNFLDARSLGSVTKDMISWKHLVICSLRLRDFLIWADHIQVTIFISDGQASVLQTEPVSGDHQIQLGDQRKDGDEREVIVTVKAADITKPFGFVFEGRLETPSLRYWVPRVSKSRQLAQDIRAQREDNFDVQDVGFENFPEPELVISDVISTCHLIDDIPIRAESSDQNTPHPPSQKGLRWCRNSWYIVKMLFVVYLLAHYVIIQFGIDRQSVEDAKGKVMDGMDYWTDLAVKMSQWTPGRRIELGEQMHQQIGDEVHQQIERDLGEPEGEREAHQPLMQELSFRDRIDRALGWKGPTGDW